MPSYTTVYKPAYPGTTSPHYPGSGAPHYPSTGFAPPPGSPILWYDAQDINLLGNVGINDADPIGTWKNKGSIGSSGDVVQAGVPSRPLFRLVAASGKINNLSAVDASGTQELKSSAFTAIAQPYLLAIVFKVNNLAAQYVPFDGGGPSDTSILAGTGVYQLAAGAAHPTQAVAAATWETCVSMFNGAASFNRLNGAQSANGNAGANTISSSTVFNFSGGGFTMPGMIAELLLYGPTLQPTPASVEAYLNAKYGITPQ